MSSPRRRCAASVLALVAACTPPRPPSRQPPPSPDLATRFPLAALDDRALCDRLLARTAADHGVVVDPEPARRRKVIVSDLHLGPGDHVFPGIEDFYAGDTWATFLADQAARGPTDLIIAGDFIDFWQLASARGDLPRRDGKVQPARGPVLASDQDGSLAALALVLAAHPDVFRQLGAFLGRGDHRVILLAGNHDADLLWPKVQLAIARAIAPVDPARLVFVDGAAYEHGGVHVEHGHAYDAANRFTAGHAPFGRDRDGRCRLEASWGEIFVDQFYTETERQIPFIDNLYPESAAVLWALREHPDPARDVGATLRFVELIRTAETHELNRDALGAMLQGALGLPGASGRGPGSVREVVDHVSSRLSAGDASARALTDGLARLRFDPELAGLWDALARAATALPDLGAALTALGAIDGDALGHLRDEVFGDALETAAHHLLSTRPGLDVVVFGHTHEVGGSLHPIALSGRTGYYANTGSWISIASVADLRARGLGWDQLSLADRATFPSKMTAVIVEYDGQVPRTPIVHNAP